MLPLLYTGCEVFSLKNVQMKNFLRLFAIKTLKYFSLKLFYRCFVC